MAYPSRSLIKFTEVNPPMISKRKFLFSVLGVIAVIILTIFGVKALCEKWQEKTMDTNELFFTALEDLQRWQSYRYTLEAELQLDNYQIAKTVINGESDVDGNLHICGEIMDTKMEAYQFGNDHYRYHSAANRWVHQENSPLPDNGVLRMTINPIENFQFSDTISVTYKEKIKDDGHKYYRFIVVPKEGFHIADAYFTDFRYTLHIDTETKQITEAVIHGVSRTESENKLTLCLRFYDVNEEFHLQPPTP